MGIVIGIWWLVLVLAIVVASTVASWGFWRRRLAALRQECDRHRQAELNALRQERDRELQAELAALRQECDRQQRLEVRDLIREFNHQAVNCLRPIKDGLFDIGSRAQAHTAAGTAEWVLATSVSLERIKDYEWRLTRLIENMAFVSRLEAPDFSLRFSQVKLDVIVGDVVAEFQELADPGGIALTWQARPQPFPRITASDDGLRQVFIILIDNAIKYCKKKGNVHVELEADEAKNVVYARCKDTGPGIPQEDWERIFEKGYRVEDARGRRPRGQGQGLGLYIARLIIEKHGGTIVVESSELGKGTTFLITLPIQRN